MKSRYIAILLISIFVVQITPTLGEVEVSSENFKLKLIIPWIPNRIKEAKFIQSSLFPLGIDVELEYTFSENAIYRFEDSEKWDLLISSWLSSSRTGQVELEFFKSNYALGNNTYDLDNREWQKWQLSDTGITQQEVDQMLSEMYFASSVSEGQEVTQQFQKLYMEKLLYDVPLVYNKQFNVIRKGLEGIDLDHGLISSIALGANWLNNPENRVSDNVTLVLPNNLLGMRIGQFLFEGLGSSVGGRLVIVEDNLEVHPDIAIQWEKGNWILPNGTVIEGGKHTFKIREDAYWANSYDFEYNNITGPFPIRPEDFAFGYDLTKYHVPCLGRDRTIAWICNDRWKGWEIDQEDNTISFFTSQPSYDDIDVLNKIIPLPSFYLNRTLSFAFNPSLQGSALELKKNGIEIQFTSEYMELFGKQQFSSGPYPFTMNSYDTFVFETRDSFTAQLRDDYWYPNEWDAPGGDFILHEPGLEGAYYYTFNQTSSNPKQKPTTLGIQTLILPWKATHPLYNDADIQEVPNDLASIKQFQSNPDFNIVERRQRALAGDALIFNLNNEHLRKINVRLAIAHALDKQALITSFDGKFFSVDSPVNPYMTEWYSDQWKIPYDYSQARDFMREENYIAADSNLQPIDLPSLGIKTILVPIDGVPLNMISIYLGIVVLTVLRRRKLW